MTPYAAPLAVARDRLTRARVQLAVLKAVAAAAGVDVDPALLARAESNLQRLANAVAALDAVASVVRDATALLEEIETALPSATYPRKDGAEPVN